MVAFITSITALLPVVKEYLNKPNSNIAIAASLDASKVDYQIVLQYVYDPSKKHNDSLYEYSIYAKYSGAINQIIINSGEKFGFITGLDMLIVDQSTQFLSKISSIFGGTYRPTRNKVPMEQVIVSPSVPSEDYNSFVQQNNQTFYTFERITSIDEYLDYEYGKRVTAPLEVDPNTKLMVLRWQLFDYHGTKYELTDSIRLTGEDISQSFSWYDSSAYN